MKKRVIFKQIVGWDAFQQRRVEGDGCLCQVTILLCDAAQDRVSRPPETPYSLVTSVYNDSTDDKTNYFKTSRRRSWFVIDFSLLYSQKTIVLEIILGSFGHVASQTFLMRTMHRHTFTFLGTTALPWTHTKYILRWHWEYVIPFLSIFTKDVQFSSGSLRSQLKMFPNWNLMKAADWYTKKFM